MSFSEGTWQQTSLLSFLPQQSPGSIKNNNNGVLRKIGPSNKHVENQLDVEKRKLIIY